MGEVRSKLLNSFMKYCAPIGWFSSPSHCYAGGIKAKMAWVFSDSQQPQLVANLVCTAYHILCKLEIQCLLCHSLGQMHREKKYRSETENVKRETIATQTKAITTRNQQHWSRYCVSAAGLELLLEKVERAERVWRSWRGQRQHWAKTHRHNDGKTKLEK